MTGLRATVRHDRDGWRLDVIDLVVPGGATAAVVGPNGAGKSTLLRALAGLVPLTGQVRIDGDDVTHRPPHLRRVGYVPQDRSLFPHLSVRDNVAFGPRRSGLPRRVATARADEWLERLHLMPLARRRPATLSGGESGRVALARALAAEPRLLLLDEPLAAVDRAARAELRRALREHLTGYAGATLVVTHDPVDAATLADRVIVLADGRVEQDASPVELARAPRSAWAAALLGLNAWPGTFRDGTCALDAGGELMAADPVAEGRCLAVVSPTAVAVHLRPPEGSPRNAWPGTVAEMVPLGSRVRVSVAGQPDVVAEVTPASVHSLGLVEGTRVWVSVKATEVTLTAV